MSASTAPFAHRDAILSWLRQRHDELAALLSELVAIPTENPPGKNYRPCVDLLETRLRQAGLDCRRLGPNTDAETLFASYGTAERTLYFHGHYDVVPAQSPQQFQPARKDHFLFGRGSADMKGGIVAMFYAVRALKELGIHLNGKICLTLVPDEETGGAKGSDWLRKQGLLGLHGLGMLLAEPTGGVVWNANRGAISVRVGVKGKPAHVGLQHRGENAFERMHTVVAKRQELKREVERRKTQCAIGPEQSANSILLLGGESGGGTNFNVVPAECWFTIDRRINPEEDLAAEKGRLLDVLKSCRRQGMPLDWEIFQEGAAASSDEHAPLGHALSQSIRAVTGEPARFEMCPGLLENRFYATQGIPAYSYGPGLLSVAHGPNEYVDLHKLTDASAIYALTALQLLNS